MKYLFSVDPRSRCHGSDPHGGSGGDRKRMFVNDKVAWQTPPSKKKHHGFKGVLDVLCEICFLAFFEGLSICEIVRSIL